MNFGFKSIGHQAIIRVGGAVVLDPDQQI